MEKIVFLPCEKDSEIAIICNELTHVSDEDQNQYKLKTFEKEFIDEDAHTLPQHLYLVSDEEIKNGEYAIYDNGHNSPGFIVKALLTKSGYVYRRPEETDETYGHAEGGITPLSSGVKKITATTDPDLIKYVEHISLETTLKCIDAYNNNILEDATEVPKTYTREDIEALFDLFEKDIQHVASGVYGGGIKHWLKENL